MFPIKKDLVTHFSRCIEHEKGQRTKKMGPEGLLTIIVQGMDSFL